MSLTSKDKALQDADRESRIMAFLEAMPEDMEPAELESVIFAIVRSYMPEQVLPLFFFYLGSTYKTGFPFDEPTTH
jgi:hypothetical protein